MNYSGDAVVEFESEEELEVEFENNLSAGGLCFPAEASLPELSSINLTLRLSGQGEILVAATIVRHLDGALAVAIEERPEKILAALNTRPVAEGAAPQRKEQNAWDRVRDLT